MRGQAGGVLDQVEEPLVGPLEVVDGDQHRALVGERSDQMAPRAANGRRVAVGVAAVEGRRQGGRGVLGVRCAGSLESRGKCCPDLLGAGAAGSVRRATKQLRQCPERDPVPVGRVAPGEQQRGRIERAGHGDQLAYEAGLACASLPDDQGQPGPALADRPLVGEPEGLELGAATVERRLLRRRTDGSDRVGIARADRRPGLDRRRESLRDDLARIAERRRPAGACRPRAHQHLAGLGRLLQARRRVGGFARHRQVAAR